MSVSEHANYLLNEYGRLQFDYAAYCKPYGESLRNEARNNLEEYIAELENKQRLIPVSERMPRLFETVLIWAYCDCDGYDRFDLAYNSGLVWVGTQQDIEYEDVTHWMPLPQPPEVQE